GLTLGMIRVKALEDEIFGVRRLVVAVETVLVSERLMRLRRRGRTCRRGWLRRLAGVTGLGAGAARTDRNDSRHPDQEQGPCGQEPSIRAWHRTPHRSHPPGRGKRTPFLPLAGSRHKTEITGAVRRIRQVRRLRRARGTGWPLVNFPSKMMAS